MANELTVGITFNFNKSNCQQISAGLSASVTVAGTYTSAGTQLIGTADETVVVSTDMGTKGWCLFQNLDGTNYIDIGNDGSNYAVRLLAGEIALFRFNGTIHAKANTGSCKLAFTVIEA